METKNRLDLIINFVEEIKAKDISTLDVKAKTSVADYFVVCTGTSNIHVKSIAENVLAKMKDNKVKPLREEFGDGGWVLVDYGDVILHVMLEENRQFYDIESLWNNISPSDNLA